MKTRLFFIGIWLLLAQCAGTSLPRYCDRSPATSPVSQSPKDYPMDRKANPRDRQEFIKKQWELYDIVKTLLRTPYQWGGEQPRSGMDCSGLTFYAYKEKLGYPLQRTAKEQYHQGKAIEMSEIRFGDLIFFSRHPSSKSVNHVGIYVNNRKFLHASSSNGVTVTQLDTPYWKNRIVGARRILHEPEQN
ncbi:MAG: C40 family peptidase [Candidatus Delongbacteria bacterium]|nr:C40 family peptidase [Candidatus Delongbacteria bacterium]